jgi:TonB-dependent receptor
MMAHSIRRGAKAALLVTSAIVAAPAVMAQEAPAPIAKEPAAAEIVVTGFRASLNSALGVKKASAAAVDVIKAEDIAEFPDLNLAESLQRIPGVAINRVNGEGRNVSVRGLGADYTRVRINGMEAIGTTGGTDTRAASTVVAALTSTSFLRPFNSLAVRKSASADVEEGSLGATVDMQTARPFDFKKPTVTFSAQASYNDLARKTTPRLSALVTKSNDDQTFGVLMSFSYEARRLKEEGANITRWTYGGFNGGFNAASTVPGYTIGQINSANMFHPRIPGLVSYDIDQKRLGASASIQWRPGDRTLLTLDGLFSYLDGTRAESQFQAISFSRSGTGKPQTIIRNGTVDGNGNLISGTFDNVDLRTQARYDAAHDVLQSDGQSGTFLFDRLKFTGLVGYSKSAFTNPTQTTVTLDAANTGNFFYDFSTRFPTIRPGVDITNPANFSFNSGTSGSAHSPQTVDNAFGTAKGAVEWKANDILKVKAGVDWRRFTYGSTEQRRLSGETVVNTLTPAQIAAATTVFSGFGVGWPFRRVRPRHGWCLISTPLPISMASTATRPMRWAGSKMPPRAVPISPCVKTTLACGAWVNSTLATGAFRCVVTLACAMSTPSNSRPAMPARAPTSIW